MNSQNPLVRHALLIERIDGPLNDLSASLRSLGYQVMRASDGQAIAGFVRSLKRLSLVIVSAETLKSEPAQLVGSIREQHAEVPILWFAPDGRLPRVAGEKLDLVKELKQVEEWFAQRARGELYAPDFVQRLIATSQDVLGQFSLPSTPSEPILTRGSSPLNELNAFIFVSAEKLGGYLILSSSVADLSQAIHSQFSRRAPGREGFEDLLGEVANQIMGQVKRSLKVGECRMGLPHFVRGPGASFRHKSGAPALVLEFSKLEQRVRLELSFHRFDGAPVRLEGGGDTQLEPGTPHFL